MIDINKEIDRMVEREVPKAEKSELEYRRNLMGLAKYYGIEVELKRLFDKYDLMLKKCTNPVEKKHIAVGGILEINKLFNFNGGLAVNDVQIVPVDPNSLKE